MTRPAPTLDLPQPSRALFSAAVPLPETRLPEFVEDFFFWLEHEWQLPVAHHDPAPPPLPLPERPSDAEIYTISDLSRQWGWAHRKMRYDLKKLCIPVAGTRPNPGRGGSESKKYRGRDLSPIVAYWEWQRLSERIDTHWKRFFKDPCGWCASCRQTQSEDKPCWSYCVGNHLYGIYRRYFFSVVQGIRTCGSVAAWWQREAAAMRAHRAHKPPSHSGPILFYLLDRRYLVLTWDELLLIFPFSGIEKCHLIRPWRTRRPEESNTLLRVMADYQVAESQSPSILSALAMLLVQHGVEGVAELGSRLTSEEMEAAVQQRELLTPHIYADISLPYPQSSDIRLGHVLLDRLRMFMWHYAHTHSNATKRDLNLWPFSWRLQHLRHIEQLLCSHLWYGNQGILVPRPETKGSLFNPYRHQDDTEHAEIALSQLPPFVKEQVNAFIHRRHQEDHFTLPWIGQQLRYVLEFLRWAHQHIGLERVQTWDAAQCQHIFANFDVREGRKLSPEARSILFFALLTWFETLAQMGLPVPPGYRVLYPFARRPHVQRKEKRTLPAEAVLDRVFWDGVCHLPDRSVRLALTIQYYCGTRIQETLDMHLFSIWEDEQGRAYLTIPIGKSKEERLFPIAPVGMEPLVALMEEVVRPRLRPGSIPRARVLANHYYLDTDPEKASSWYYLFDRYTYHQHQPSQRKSVLSPKSVDDALRHAVLLAAYTNPSDLFQEGTYHPTCRRLVSKGSICGYLALRAGITLCPVCGGKFKGQRGERCWRRVKQDYACTGVASEGVWFCPVCDAPLAQPRRITTHLFRHNSVTRASRRGMPLAHNMLLHGHRTVTMHMQYHHPQLEDLHDGIQEIMAQLRLREARVLARFAPGQVVINGVSQTPALEQYLGLTLRRSLRRETAKVWGGFVAHVLADEGIHSPVRGGEEIILTEETYAHTVAQYRYDALGLAISEVALEHQARGKHRAQVPPYFDRDAIEQLVQQHLSLEEQLPGELAIHLMQAEITRQRRFLEELATMLQPWWQHYGSIDHLVRALTPTGVDLFDWQGGNNGA